ncbi:MAG: tetratricopeptide repeat protein [Proteobacteria bacterium]|nr:tetratricopeptide repeat protein [Pseudomonadota bacterium]
MNTKIISEMAATYFLVSMMVALALPVQAEQGGLGMNYFVDGLEAYDNGDYDTALNAFGQAIEMDGGNLQFQYYSALAYSKMGKEKEAGSIFSAIVAREPQAYNHVFFDLAGIYIRQKDYDRARKTLDDAERAVPDNPRASMEKGYLARAMKDFKGAEVNFKRAMELNSQLAQVVYYEMGLIHLEIRQFDSAKDMFRKAVALGPDSDIARAAKQALENIGGMKRSAKPWHLVSSLGWAYDSNIPNDPLDLPGISTTPATDLGDQYQTFALNGYYRIAFKNAMTLDTGYLFSYLNYSDPDNESSMGNSPYVRLSYSKKNWTGDLRYSYGYYSADGHSKQMQHALAPTIVFFEPWDMQTVCGLVYQDKDYLDDGLTPDATHLALKIKQGFKIPGKAITPMIGVTFGDENADTDASSYRYFETMAGVSLALPYGIGGDFSFTDIRSTYDVTYGSSKRKDTGYMISALFSKKVVDAVTARLFYLYVKNDSNVMTSSMAPDYDPYEYEKHIVQIQMEVTL